MIFYNKDSLNVLLVLFIFAELLFGAVAFWALLFSSYYLAFLLFITMAIILPLKLQSYMIWLCRGAGGLLFILLVAFTYNIPIKETNKNIHKLSQKLESGKSSANNFTIKEKLGLYGLHFFMSICAYPIYPEASKEALFMHIKPSKKAKNKRIFNLSSHPESKYIKNTLLKAMSDFTQDTEDITIKPQRIKWSPNIFSIAHHEARYAYAFNPCTISGVSVKAGNKRLTTWNLKVSVNYARKYRVTLSHSPKLTIEQGLYRMLQDSGWLHGYEATWKFSTVK